MWYKNDLVTLTLNFKSKRSSNNIDVLIDHFLYKIKIHHEVEFFMIKYIFSVYWKLLLVSMYISFYVGENCYPFFLKPFINTWFTVQPSKLSLPKKMEWGFPKKFVLWLFLHKRLLFPPKSTIKSNKIPMLFNGGLRMSGLGLELYKNKFKNLIWTSKFKFSFRGLHGCFVPMPGIDLCRYHGLDRMVVVSCQCQA